MSPSPIDDEILAASDDEILAALAKRYLILCRPLKSGARRILLTLKPEAQPRRPRRRASTAAVVNPAWRLEAKP